MERGGGGMERGGGGGGWQRRHWVEGKRKTLSRDGGAGWEAGGGPSPAPARRPRAHSIRRPPGAPPAAAAAASSGPPSGFSSATMARAAADAAPGWTCSGRQEVTAAGGGPGRSLHLHAGRGLPGPSADSPAAGPQDPGGEGMASPGWQTPTPTPTPTPTRAPSYQPAQVSLRSRAAPPATQPLLSLGNPPTPAPNLFPPLRGSSFDKWSRDWAGCGALGIQG
jgi:hypothetical protein